MTTTDITKTTFAPDDMVVYPGHGVGKVMRIEIQRVGGQEIQLFVISFEQDRMTLRVPLQKATTSGLRKLSTRRVMQKALETLKEPADQKREIWNRRALKYAVKINSGDPVAIAEVVRDLRRGSGDRERSHSERLLYEQALHRLTREYAAIEQTQLEPAMAAIELLLVAA